MSLVEYGSSDDELEETLNEIDDVKQSPGKKEETLNETVDVNQLSTMKKEIESSSNSIKNLLASLPEPRYSAAGSITTIKRSEVEDQMNSPNELLAVCEKKQKQPVKILIPSINEFEEDDIPKKKQKLLQISTGLVDMLPAPRNTTLGKAAEKLVPYILTKKIVKPPSGITASKVSKPTSTPLNKNSSTALVAYDDKDSDDDDNTSNDFFSLGKCESFNTHNRNQKLHVDDSSAPHTLLTNLQMPPTAFVGNENIDNNDKKQTYKSNTLLETCKPININNGNYDSMNVTSEIKTAAESVSIPNISSNNENDDVPLSFRPDWASNANFSKPQQYCKEFNVVHPSQQRKNFVTKSELQEVSTVEVAKDIDVTDERFLRLQGKKHRGKEDIQIIDISADQQQLPGVANILMKNLTEELVYKPSRKKGEMPTTQQRRKHQITYLAFQAKERELELKNQWSSNRMTRRQTQAKYGF